MKIGSSSRNKLNEKIHAEMRRIAIKRHPYCVCCGASGEGVVLQGGHLIPKKSSTAVRYCLLNVFTQCTSCNFKHQYNQSIFTDWFIREYGVEEYQELEKYCNDNNIKIRDSVKFSQSNYYVFNCIEINSNNKNHISYSKSSKIYISCGYTELTFQEFKQKTSKFNLAEFLKDNAVRVLDEQQFNDMFNILDKYNVQYDAGIKDLWVLDNAYLFECNNSNLCRIYNKNHRVNNILSYQDFISIINYNSNIYTKELTKKSLKKDIEKYLIKDKDATKDYNNLLDFIDTVNSNYNLNLNI